MRLPTVKELRRVVMWTANRKFTSGSAVVIFNANDQILLVRERFRDRNAWGLPGGYLKRGESHESNMRREIREELNIDVATVTFVAFSVQDGVDHFDGLYTVTLDPSPVPKPGREIREIAWFTSDDLPSNTTPVATRALQVMWEATADTRLGRSS